MVPTQTFSLWPVSRVPLHRCAMTAAAGCTQTHPAAAPTEPKMSRYKGRTSLKSLAREFPYTVETTVPEGGLGRTLERMYEFHMLHGIKARTGAGRVWSQVWPQQLPAMFPPCSAGQAKLCGLPVQTNRVLSTSSSWCLLTDHKAQIANGRNPRPTFEVRLASFCRMAKSNLHKMQFVVCWQT